MQDSLIEAFFNADHKVLGRKLKPLTLRHCFMLSVAKNPILTGEVPTWEDLIQAVEICSRDSNYFLKGKSPSKLRRYLWDIRLACYNNRLKQFSLFSAYLKDYFSPPVYWSSGDSKPNKVNWIISNVSLLVKMYSMPFEEAWNMTVGEASWWIAAGYNNDPSTSVDIMTDEEIAGIEAMKALSEEDIQKMIAAADAKD